MPQLPVRRAPRPPMRRSRSGHFVAPARRRTDCRFRCRPAAHRAGRRDRRPVRRRSAAARRRAGGAVAAVSSADAAGPASPATRARPSGAAASASRPRRDLATAASRASAGRPVPGPRRPRPRPALPSAATAASPASGRAGCTPRRRWPGCRRRPRCARPASLHRAAPAAGPSRRCRSARRRQRDHVVGVDDAVHVAEHQAGHQHPAAPQQRRGPGPVGPRRAAYTRPWRPARSAPPAAAS